jgi:ureidoacrylate peracid hydrolase
MNSNETAIVLIEFQNDFTSEGGIFHEAVKGVMDETDMLSNTVNLIEQSRNAGVQVIHVAISFAENYNELTQTPYGILKGIVDNKAFIKSTWGAKIIDELTPLKDDIIIEGKRGLCGFHSTNLGFILRSKGIRNVAIGGFLTNCCVE